MSALTDIELSVGDVVVVIDPAAGGRARSWRVGAHELLFRRGADPVEHGMYPMAPWAGRLRGNAVVGPDGLQGLPTTYRAWALHGTVLDQKVEIRHLDRGPGHHEVVLATRSHPTWPWPMEVSLCWRVEPRRVITTITLTSTTDGMPYVVGWHPWFRRVLADSPARVDFHAEAMLERGADALPVGLVPVPDDGPFDDAFLVPDGAATISWPGALALEIHQTGSWFVLFDEHPDALCLEPQSGPPDGLDDRPWHAAARLTADRPWTHTTTWTIRDLQEGRG